MRALSRFALLVAGSSLLAAAPAVAQEQEGPVSGRITTPDATVEILPGPPPVGERVDRYGGWYRIESGPEEPGPTGSFSVMPAQDPAPVAEEPAVRAAPREAVPEPRRVRARPAGEEQRLISPDDACYAQKERVAKELFRIAGIWSFDRPLEWVEVLQQHPALSLSPWVRFNLFGLAVGGPLGVGAGVDPIRALGWDEGLRWAADDLLDCQDRQR